MRMIEVGHCKECCRKYDIYNKCNLNHLLIKHLEKDICPFCKKLETKFHYGGEMLNMNLDDWLTGGHS